MVARAGYALVALAALGCVCAEPIAYVYVREPSEEGPSLNDVEDIERRYTPELLDQLEMTKNEALLLYTEYTSRSGEELNAFMTEMSGLTRETLAAVDEKVLGNVSADCRAMFDRQLSKATSDAHRAASFSSENHHKFLLGHMIVFRMHLNKSEDYISKCDKVYKDCGIACETTPRVVRWRRFAAQEINRVKDDIQHSRRSYKDILTHSHRKLNHLRRRARARAAAAVEELEKCGR